jgi:hypothetical protein
MPQCGHTRVIGLRLCCIFVNAADTNEGALGHADSTAEPPSSVLICESLCILCETNARLSYFFCARLSERTAAERPEEGSQGQARSEAERAAPGNEPNRDQALNGRQKNAEDAM